MLTFKILELVKAVYCYQNVLIGRQIFLTMSVTIVSAQKCFKVKLIEKLIEIVNVKRK